MIQGQQTKGGGGVQKCMQGMGGGGGATGERDIMDKGLKDQRPSAASKGSIHFLCGGGGGDDGGKIKEEDRDWSPSHTGTSHTSRGGVGSGVGPVDFKCDPSRNSPVWQGGAGMRKKKTVSSQNANTSGRSSNSTPTGYTGVHSGYTGVHPTEYSCVNPVKAGVEAGGRVEAVKRKRADSPPTREKDREVDKNRINKRDMWSYARMSEKSKEELEKEREREEETRVNEWEWTRKLICRPNGTLTCVI
jgi:hypothetical protein